MVKDLVPRIHFYDQDFVDMYDRTWVWIDELWKGKEDNPNFEEGYYTFDNSNHLRLFDAMLSSLFLVYSNQTYSPYSLIDFFYKMQEENGFIASEYDIDTLKPILSEGNPGERQDRLHLYDFQRRVSGI